MHGGIAEAIDEHRFGKDCRACRSLERRLVEKCAQVVLIRELERGVVLVESMHHHFQPAPCVEARGSRIGMRQRLRLARRIVRVRPLGFEEGEVGHEHLKRRGSRNPFPSA